MISIPLRLPGAGWPTSGWTLSQWIGVTGPVARDYAHVLLAEHAARRLDVDGILDLIERAGIS
jgi:hypothetical protein